MESAIFEWKAMYMYGYQAANEGTINEYGEAGICPVHNELRVIMCLFEQEQDVHLQVADR